MNILIIILFFINFALLLLNYLHMYQLNFYKTGMYLHWCRVNIPKIILRLALSLIPLLTLTGNLALQILSALILVISSILLIPRHTKIPLKITGRIIRLIVVEIILSAIVLAINPSEAGFIIRLAILCSAAPALCLIANLILFPAETIGRKRYIDGAKKILADRKDLVVIGITGSYGKTSVKNFLGEILSEKYSVLITPKNYNTELGIARTIRKYLKPTHNIFICEMGAMWEGDIAKCCEIAQPKYGIITAIDSQHLQTFGSLEAVARAKFELATAVIANQGKLYLNYDNENVRQYSTDANQYSYGLDSKFDFYANHLKSSEDGQSFEFHHGDQALEIQTKLLGVHNIENLTGAIAIAKEFGVSDEDIKFAVRRIKSVPHRLEYTSRGNLGIIDDSYNSNPISSKLAVDTLTQFPGKTVVVTPGLIELGSEEERYNQELGEYIAKQGIDYVYLVGNSPQADAVEAGLIRAEFSSNKVQRVTSPQEAVSYATRKYPADNLTILLLNDLPDNY